MAVLVVIVLLRLGREKGRCGAGKGERDAAGTPWS